MFCVFKLKSKSCFTHYTGSLVLFIVLIHGTAISSKLLLCKFATLINAVSLCHLFSNMGRWDRVRARVDNTSIVVSTVPL